jgi:geranylgeranyl diphosphate synthase type I
MFADIEQVLRRYRTLLADGLRESLAAARAAMPPAPAAHTALDELYGQVEYHFGWRDAALRLAANRPGKLLRPTLLLLAYELAVGKSGLEEETRAELLRRALPAAVAVELVHNFSLVHDDIEDGDEARHGRPTMWTLWGVSQALNTGDGIFAMARLELLRLAERGVPAPLVVELAALLDQTSLALCEGQFLDMRFEGRHDLTVALYLEMIARKTAALMACPARMGARLGAPEDAALAARLGDFGRELGIAFQLRDDLLGIWAAEALGKTSAGDLRRKKMTLPVIAALEAAAPADRATLLDMYAQPGPAGEEQVATVLAILDRTGARERARATLREQCAAARAALEAAAGDAPAAGEVYEALATLLAFVAAEAA